MKRTKRPRKREGQAPLLVLIWLMLFGPRK